MKYPTFSIPLHDDDADDADANDVDDDNGEAEDGGNEGAWVIVVAFASFFSYTRLPFLFVHTFYILSHFITCTV